jgi:hypothetical protein
MAYLRATVASCPSEERHGVTDTYALTERDAGEEGFLVTQETRHDQSGEAWMGLTDVARVGDLLLLNVLHLQDLSEEAVGRGREVVTTTTDKLATEMGGFAGRTVD